MPSDDHTGWHALPMTPEHTMRDGLFDRGRLVAIVEAFGDRGPWYGNAEAPDGTAHRGGPSRDHAAAAEWCERVAVGAGRGGRGEGVRSE